MPDIAALRRELDTYKDTVSAILAFIHGMLWQPEHESHRKDAVHEHGSPQRWKDGESAVTPDIALLAGTEWGVIGEAKLSFGGAQDKTGIRDQLHKYDCVADAWCATEIPPGKVAEASVVLLTHQSRKADAAEYLDAELAAGRLKNVRPLAVVSYNRSDQAVTYYALERAWGKLIPVQKDEALRRVVNIRLEQITASYGGVKFYDAPPPMPYLLHVIWDCVLPSMIPEQDFQTRSKAASRGGKRAPTVVDVSVADIARLLRDGFSLRLLNPALPECPRPSQVERALGCLVDFGLATKQGGSSYRVGYRRLRDGALNYFLAKLATPTGTAPAVVRDQLDLFTAERPNAAPNDAPPSLPALGQMDVSDAASSEGTSE